MKLFKLILLGIVVALIAACDASGDPSEARERETELSTDTATALSTDTATDSVTDAPTNGTDDTSHSDTDVDRGVCQAPCNGFTPQSPTLIDNGGTGSITTYGSVSDPETSSGGACNYGATGIQYYAAVHVNLDLDDDLGPWNDGRACGGCLAVRVKTEQGWQKTVVRITDRCADQFCGVDLGGAPARDTMTVGPGRYEGDWQFVSCEGHPEVFDGPTSLYVKDGSNGYWSLVQVRNPLSAVTGLSYQKEGETVFTPMEWAIEAENFFSVPPDILQDESQYNLRVEYQFSEPQTISIAGNALSNAQSMFEL